MSVKSIGIIGAGWSGLQLMQVFIECGYEVQVFEEQDEVGGTWHPAIAYEGLGIHAPIFTAQFHDFDNFKNQNRFLRLMADDVFENCKAFARENGLYDHINFNCRAIAVNYDKASDKMDIEVKDVMTNAVSKHRFDFVVSTQFNAPLVPHFPGQEKFRGQIIHVNHFKKHVMQEIVKEKKNVVVCGASKAATDLAFYFAQRNYRLTWLIRKMYWFLSYDKVSYDLKKGKQPSRFHRMLLYHGMMKAADPRYRNLVFWLWRAMGIIRNPGQKHSDFNKFHFGVLDEFQVDVLENRTNQVYGEIDSLDGNHIVTKDGKKIDCDLLICATGINPIAFPFKLKLDNRELKMDEVDLSYKTSIIPEFPRLCFTGYYFFGFGPLNAYHRAAWILNYIEKNLSTEELKKIANKEAAVFGKVFGSRHQSYGTQSPFSTTMKLAPLMREGIYEIADIPKYLYDLHVNAIYKPYQGVERFLSARRVKKTATADQQQGSKRAS